MIRYSSKIIPSYFYKNKLWSGPIVPYHGNHKLDSRTVLVHFDHALVISPLEPVLDKFLHALHTETFKNRPDFYDRFDLLSGVSLTTSDSFQILFIL